MDDPETKATLDTKMQNEDKHNTDNKKDELHGAHGNNIFLDFEWFHDIIKPEINPI